MRYNIAFRIAIFLAIACYGWAATHPDEAVAQSVEETA